MVSESVDVEVGAMGAFAEAESTVGAAAGAEVFDESTTGAGAGSVIGCTSVDGDCVVSVLDEGCGAASGAPSVPLWPLKALSMRK